MRESVRDTARIPKLNMTRTVIVVAVIVVGLVLVLVLHRSPSSGPPLATSCTTPAIALDSSSTRAGRGIDYAITGPKTGTYVLAVDAASVAVHGRDVRVSPPAGFAVAVHQGLSSCKAHGTLPSLAPGTHQVELFRSGVLAAKAELR